METTDIKNLLENWYKYSRFDLARKIYDYTDKFHPFLVKVFIDEYKEYNNGLELDIKNFSTVNKITGKPPVISLEIDKMGDLQLFIDDKEYDSDLFMPTMGKIFSSTKFGAMVDDIEAKKTTDEEPEPLDLSDTTTVEKIIYLNELGIIDFLRTKTKTGISNNGLASTLSGITGSKAETIKPSINRIANNDTDDQRHPYYNKIKVDKIKKILTQLGF